MKKELNLTKGRTLLHLKPLNLSTNKVLNLIIWVTDQTTIATGWINAGNFEDYISRLAKS